LAPPGRQLGIDPADPGTTTPHYDGHRIAEPTLRSTSVAMIPIDECRLRRAQTRDRSMACAHS
jgi:hypothetical protein